MNDIDKAIRLNKSIVSSMEKLFKKVDWSNSLFLRAARKNLESQYNKALERLEKAQALKAKSSLPNVLFESVPEGWTVVYIILYCADGADLNKWADKIIHLAESSVGRPIYSEKMSAQKALKASGAGLREGYVSVAVPPGAVLTPPPGREIKDRFGNALLTVRSKDLSELHVLGFSHLKQSYRFKHNKLSVISDS